MSNQKKSSHIREKLCRSFSSNLFSAESDRAWFIISNTTKVLPHLVEPTYSVSPTVHAHASTQMQNTCDITPAISRRFMIQKTIMNILDVIFAQASRKNNIQAVSRVYYIKFKKFFEEPQPFLNQNSTRV